MGVLSVGSEQPPEEPGQEVRPRFSKPPRRKIRWLAAGAGALVGLVVLISATLAVVLFVMMKLEKQPTPVKSPAPTDTRPLKEEEPKPMPGSDSAFEQVREFWQRYLDAKARGDFKDEVKGKEILADLRDQLEKASKGIDLTAILTGALPFILTTAGLLVFPVSFLLLRRYRRAVLRSMGRRTGATEGLSRDDDTLAPPSPRQVAPLRIITLGETEAFSLTPAAQALSTQAGRAPWRAAMVYSLGGVCFAGIMAAAFLAVTRISFGSIRFVTLAWIYGWPLVLALGLVVGLTVRTRLMVALAYFGGLAMLGAVVLALSPQSSVKSISFLWLNPNAIPTVLVLVCLTRRVRAVGPLVLTFLVLAFAGMIGLLLVLAFNLLKIVDFSLSLGLGYYGAFYGLIGLLFIVIAACAALGWLLLKWIRGGYEKKKISEQSLTLDSLWLLFGIVYSIDLATQWPGWMASGLIAFLAYKLVVRMGFAVFKGEAAGSGVRLLLLRVFSLGRRSEKLFSSLGTQWRYVGSMQMIAGPDLATTTIEPHEFLDFMVGRLARFFIDSRKTLDRRLSEMDLKPDRDWRFRVNDFFCFDDTWKMVLARLVSGSEAVLMDLRGFSPERAGCIFEIHELIDSVSLERAVFLIDQTTDEPFLRQVVSQAWDELRPTSPNYDSPSPQLRLLYYAGSESGALQRLLQAICEAARPGPPATLVS